MVCDRTLRLGIVLLIALSTWAIAYAQPGPEQQIRSMLADQADAWNRGDIEAFMEHYWKSEDLQFLGSSGLVQGWQATLDRYKTRYPDVQSMGTLTFDINEINKRSATVYSVIGQFHLAREGLDNLSGYFLLIVQQINGRWCIVADSTH